MLKKIFVFLLCLFILLPTGCFFDKKIKQDDNIQRLYLEDKYYNKGNFINIKSNDLKKLENYNYVLFTYNNYCSLPISCEDIFKQFMEKYKIDFLSIPFSEFKETTLYETVKYAPSIIIVEKGKIIAYLDAESNEDLERYQDTLEIEKWMNNYIYFSK